MADGDNALALKLFSNPYNKKPLYPRKKTIPIDEEIFTDTESRSRFYGAFTSRFLAGYFNTVRS